MRCQHLSLFADHDLRMTKHLLVEEIPLLVLFNDLIRRYAFLLNLHKGIMEIYIEFFPHGLDGFQSVLAQYGIQFLIDQTHPLA